RSRSARPASPRRSRASGTTARWVQRSRRASARRELRPGPAGGGGDRAVERDQSRRQAGALEPGGRAPGGNERRRTRDVRIHTAGRGNADRPPAAVDRTAAGRIENVVDVRLAAPPAPHRRARRGQAAGAQCDRLSGLLGRRGVVVGDADRPAAGRRRAGGRDVPADAHQHATVEILYRARRGDVGRERLGGRAVVELDARRHAEGRARIVQLDASPAAGPPEADRTAGADRGEVPVVAGGAQRGADRRVEVAVGQSRGAQRAARGTDEQPAHLRRRAAGGVDPAELGVIAEATAREVDLLDHLAYSGRRSGQLARLAGEHHHSRAQRPPRGRGTHRVHEPPETPTGATGVATGAWFAGARPVAGLDGVWVADTAPVEEEAFASVWPWKAWEAIRASAPERPTTPTITQRVTAEIRRSPASRAITARRLASSAGPALRGRGTRGFMPRTPAGRGWPLRRSKRRWLGRACGNCGGRRHK